MPLAPHSGVYDIECNELLKPDLHTCFRLHENAQFRHFLGTYNRPRLNIVIAVKPIAVQIP